MSAHTCTTLTEGCYRCDLNRDEIAAYADSLLVSYHGVVHESDCRSVRNARVVRWVGPDRLVTDRACKHCLPDGLPAAAQST